VGRTRTTSSRTPTRRTGEGERTGQTDQITRPRHDLARGNQNGASHRDSIASNAWRTPHPHQCLSGAGARILHALTRANATTLAGRLDNNAFACSAAHGKVRRNCCHRRLGEAAIKECQSRFQLVA